MELKWCVSYFQDLQIMQTVGGVDSFLTLRRNSFADANFLHTQLAQENYPFSIKLDGKSPVLFGFRWGKQWKIIYKWIKRGIDS